MPTDPPHADPHPAWSPARRLTYHTLSTVLIQSTWQAVAFILPVLVKRQFDAAPWQVLLITMTPLVMAILSIFWQAALRRSTIARSALVYWSIALLPVGLIAGVHNFWTLFVLHAISSIGAAAWSSIHGELLKRLYPDTFRGRAFGTIAAVSTLGAAALSWAVGEALSYNSESFRWFLPGLALLQLAGALLLAWLARRANAERPPDLSVEAWSPARAFEPILHMREVLRADRTFFRYEAAFMTYGIGWMICWALLPLIVTDRLKLPYDQVTQSTAVAYQLALVAATLPAGWINDRLGPTRTSAIAFAVYTLYPVLLITASGPAALAVASVAYGIAAAGANVGWMLGPVSLAPSPDKVPQYVAIHTSLVGLRGTVFQGLGVGLYSLTGSFTFSLIIAAAGFAWGSWQMVALHRSLHAPITPPSTSRNQQPPSPHTADPGE